MFAEFWELVDLSPTRKIFTKVFACKKKTLVGKICVRPHEEKFASDPMKKNLRHNLPQKYGSFFN